MFIEELNNTPTDAESPEVDRFTVQLKKDENGLGITIAGNGDSFTFFFHEIL